MLQVLLMGAVIALLFLLPALVHNNYREMLFPSHAQFKGRLSAQAGVVSYTYTSAFIGNGGATAPTAIQASQLQQQSAVVFFADTDIQAVVIHNWGNQLAPSFASYYFPIVLPLLKLLGGATELTFSPDFTFGLTNSNSVTINKNTVAVGSGGTYLVQMFRPQSIGG